MKIDRHLLLKIIFKKFTFILSLLIILLGCNQSTKGETNPFISPTATVEVEVDYKNTTSCPSTLNTIISESISTNKLQVNINFQPHNAQTPRDYLADTGLPFANRDNGYSYGWSSDVSEWARDRNANNTKDQRYDTLVHMKHNSLPIDAYWEIELPNKNYSIKLVSGDSSIGYCGKSYKIAVENVLAINETPNCPDFIEKNISVTVKDGLLTIAPLTDSIDAKISFIEITEDDNQPDTLAPSNVFNEKITVMNEQLLLEWENPLYDFAGTLVIYDTKPIDFTPVQNINCSRFETIKGAQFIVKDADNRVVLSSLENEQTYYIKLFSFDESFNYSTPLSLTAIPHSISAQQEKEVSETLMETLQPGNSPEVVYETFERFAQTHFSALVTPQIYGKYGNNLTIVEESKWQYISKYSAVIAWETNLPAKTMIEYHKQNEEVQTTELSERYFYNHVHYLENLEPNTIYIYKVRAIDEREQSILSTGTFTTGLQGDVIEIPGDLGEPPYKLDKSNVTYLLTEDIISSSGAIEINSDNEGDIILDLGGNTVTFAKELHSSYDKNDITKNGMGIYRSSDWSKGKLSIVNGHLKQSQIKNTPVETSGFNPIFLQKQINLEIAGITLNYHTPQTFGIYLWSVREKVNIHHNVFLDRGHVITDRHGTSGGRAVYFRSNEPQTNDYSIHHNLIKRTRQNGFSVAKNIYNNEIYVDSWSTNSFAIQPFNENANITGNKIFLTGYHAIGVAWAVNKSIISNNFIHMEGINTAKNRWYESFGDQNSLNGLRLTNYDQGGQIRNNLHYSNNLIIGNARHGSMIRGTELFSDYSITNSLINNSIIEINAEDEKTTRVSAVVTQGTASEESKPTYYKDTFLSSNITNVRFGDSYGRGYNHHFYNVTFEKKGDNPNYHTFIFDGGYSRDGHIIRDPIFKNGAAYDDVYWQRTGDLSAYSVEWTLTIKTNVGESVEVYDLNNNLVFDGKANDNGEISIPLTQVTIRPKQWTIDSRGNVVQDKSEHQKIKHTPHRILLKNKPENEISIIMDKTKTIQL